MRLLILGGTGFLSGAVARAAVGRGHDVSSLSRGHRPVPRGVQSLVADRASGVAAYAGATGDWDAVLDVSSDPPRVREALEALAGRAAHWTYVSSLSVYARNDDPLGADESAELLPALGDEVPFSMEFYGEAKVACEQLCGAALGDRLHVSRAGLIAGRGDPTDRYGYWPAAFARAAGEPVLVPDVEAASTQVIGVDDLARWLLDGAETGVTAPLNATGDSQPFGTVVRLAAAAAGSSSERVLVDPDWLVEQQVEYWAGPDSLPLWLPPDYSGFAARSNAAATAAGLRLSPPEDLMTECLAYEQELGLHRERHAGLSPAKERELLAAWSASSDG